MSEPHGTMTREGEEFPSPPRAVEYLAVDPPKPGRARQVGERLWWARIPLPLEINHINVWLLDDDDGWMLVDTGMSNPACREAWAVLDREHLGGRPIRRIFVTHDHPDHMGLAGWLHQRYGAELWMHPYSHDWMTSLLQGGIDERRARGARFVRSHGLAIPDGALPSVGASDGESWFGTLPPLARPCADRDEFTSGGRAWRMIETGGHCRGHLCLYAAGEPLLVSGDQVLPTISPNVSVLASRPEEDPLREFLASLTDLEACGAGTLVLPSHGRPFRGLHRRIQVLQAHHKAQLDILREACVTPQTATELVPAMFGRALRGFQRYLAVGEAVAHLNHLWHGGELERTVDEQGIIRFARA